YFFYYAHYNILGLTYHLKSHFSAMFRLYEILHQSSEPPTSEEIEIASGKKTLNPKSVHAYLLKLERASEDIQKALENQAAKAAGPWDQSRFEGLLVEWIVACDQPFEEVKRPEFKQLLTYTHHPASTLHIPGHTTIQRQFIKMSEGARETLRQVFAVRT
ncbi:hypothetical protein K435DRAFT_706104, partial [Dendrothele bispora CBS 962.96]